MKAYGGMKVKIHVFTGNTTYVICIFVCSPEPCNKLSNQLNDFQGSLFQGWVSLDRYAALQYFTLGLFSDAFRGLHYVMLSSNMINDARGRKFSWRK
jgi:hypothetical protein